MTQWKSNPCFVCGHRKSGTTLLVSLFDAHPELCVFPDDSGFWYGYYPRFAGDAYMDHQKIERLINVMFAQLRSILGRLEAARGMTFPFDDAEAEFRVRVKAHSLEPAQMLEQAMFTFRDFFIQRKDQELVAWMEKTTSTEIYAGDVFQWYPNARMIHLLRDPRDNYGSLKSGWEKRYQRFNDSPNRLLQSLLERGGLGMKLAAMNKRQYGSERYKVIRYEDLTADPERVMRELAAFVGLTFEDVLLQPTTLGFPWKGNNFDGKSFLAPNPVNVGRWRERITDHEAALIEFTFRDEMKRWGYETEFSEDKQMVAAREHYKWYNFAQQYSSGGDADTFKNV